MSSRSPSSSPDVLGPAGDAEYLISSPPPEFTGRQSWVAPYPFQTPQRKPRHPSRSPNKSTHTIRFDDILLPSSPPMRLGNRQRSLSPTKVQSESNVSPWRIRVTVEAEHEDDENPESSSRKRIKSATTTTKVPLKDEGDRSQASAKKRRGRPRKSDMLEQNSTPSKGSPGRTPKPKSASATKRPRGRPRKSLPAESVAESIETDDLGGGAETNHQDGSAFDGASNGNATTSEPSGQGLNDNANTGPTTNLNRSSPVPSHQRVPVRLEPSSRRVRRIIEGDSELTPIKTQSAARRVRGVSPENTLHAGHTPRPRRMYPTPTSSSLLDDENVEETSRNLQQNRQWDEDVVPIADPTDEHREFDSIMESEGFSMVSLDSLPSAKQQGLSSILNSAKGALKPFFERQTTGSFDRTKSSTSNSNSEITQESPAAPSRRGQSASEMPNGESSSAPKTKESPHNNKVLQAKQTPAVDTVSPTVPPAPAQPNQGALKKKRTFPSLARVVRAGIALQGILRRQRRGSRLRSPFSSPTRPSTRESSEDLDGPRRRLENLFSGFALETQRELRAGLRFGEQLARRQIEAERMRKQKEATVSKEGVTPVKEAVSVAQESPAPQTHGDNLDGTDDTRPLSGIEQREAEWQREREMVSHQIQMADSSQVIVIESDAEGSQKLDSEALVSGPDEPLSEEEDDYGDIWQQEARNHRSNLNRHVLQAEEDEAQFSRTQHSRDETGSPEKNNQDSFSSDDADNPLPYSWNIQRGEIPPLGKSRLAQLKQEKVDLSPLLRAHDTPNTRRYYANSSPQTVASQYLQSPENNIKSERGRDSDHNSYHYERSSVQGEDDSSPKRDSQAAEDEEEHSDLSSAESMSQGEGDHLREDDEIVSEGLDDEDHTLNTQKEATPENTSSHQQSVVTPESASLVEPEISASKPSWFRRLTNSFTPWWAKAGSKQMEESEYDDNEPSEVHVDEAEAEALKEPTPAADRNPPPKRPRDSESPRPSIEAEPEPKKLKQTKVLATSGYFTDDHYVALRRLYSLAKRSPELFPYYPTPRRDDMIGDWLWTSDGIHGVPVTEIQFGIIDEFMRELSEADRRNGGTGEIGWSEDDLHKRLFSIIVGEQIRKERKAQAREQALQR
ncbi:hypothetical protein VTN77DRAFT_234 [Rasamsonia byssochlamydoides]|uniref:uncharacterized protein n=1 Tax=Rasamsonia byssochlamydoides TaxID=89139 RepID=UPI003743E063